MKQYFNIQLNQNRKILHFFIQHDEKGHQLELTVVANIDDLPEHWEYVRMAGDFPVFKRKTPQ
jgi:hypothetical protein